MHAWPIFDLAVRATDDAPTEVELRVPTDDELLRLVDVARAGIHPPEEMPFGRPWSEVDSPEFERTFLQVHWRRRAGVGPEAWNLLFAIFVDGDPVGIQGIDATRFARRRVVATGSWLGLQWQGRGIGTRARACVLDLAFSHLGAHAAETGAWLDNPASHRVAEKLGYAPNGLGTWVRHDVPTDARLFRMTAERWAEVRPFAADVRGLNARCRALLGASAAVGEPTAVAGT